MHWTSHSHSGYSMLIQVSSSFFFFFFSSFFSASHISLQMYIYNLGAHGVTFYDQQKRERCNLEVWQPCPHFIVPWLEIHSAKQMKHNICWAKILVRTRMPAPKDHCSQCHDCSMCEWRKISVCYDCNKVFWIWIWILCPLSARNHEIFYSKSAMVDIRKVWTPSSSTQSPVLRMNRAILSLMKGRGKKNKKTFKSKTNEAE